MDLKTDFFGNLYCPIPGARGFICAILAAVFLIATAFGADKTTKTSQCEALADLAVPGFVVEKAEIVPAGPAPAAAR